jgi:tetratricopeptide (TPR) repeat protein
MEGTCWDSLELYHYSRAHAYAAYGITLPPDQAVTYLRKSLELNPEEKTSYFNLGTFTAKLGHYDESETAFLKAIKFDPYNAEAYLRLSWVYGKMKDPAKAKEYAEKALNSNPTEEQKNRAKSYIDSCNKTLR